MRAPPMRFWRACADTCCYATAMRSIALRQHVQKVNVTRCMVVIVLLALSLLLAVTMLRTLPLRHLHRNHDANWLPRSHLPHNHEDCHLSYRFFIHPLPFLFNYATLPATILSASNGSSSIFNNGNLHVYANEIAIHFALQSHACRTYDPEQATFFFLPVYPFYMRLTAEFHPEHQRMDDALKLLHTALTTIDRRAGIVADSGASTSQVDNAVNHFFDLADDWTERDYHTLLQEPACTCPPADGVQQQDTSFAGWLNGNFVTSTTACALRNSVCLVGSTDHAVLGASWLDPYPLLAPPLPLFSRTFLNPAIKATLKMPSTYKRYLTRHRLCDHILVSSRGSTDWDDKQYWTQRQPTGAILLSNQLSSRREYFENPLVAKNVAIGQITELEYAYSVVYRQLLLQTTRLNTTSLINVSMLPTEHVGDYMHWKRAEQFTQRYEQHLLQQEQPLRQANGIRWPRTLRDRPCFSYFYGTIGTYATRQNLQRMLQSYDAENSVVLAMDATHQREVDGTIFSYAYLQSVFCWIVPGDAFFTNRLYDVVASGCIPVIVNDGWYLPYSRVVDWTAISIRFRESDLADKPEEVMRYLRSLSDEQVLAMQANLFRARPRMMYSLREYRFQSRPRDAVDSMLTELEARKEYARSCQYQHTAMDMQFTPVP